MLDSGHGLDLIRKDVSVSVAPPPLSVLPCYRIWVDVLVWFTPWYGLVLSVWALSLLLWSLLLPEKLRQCPICQLEICLALVGDKSPLSDHWRALSHFHLICDMCSEASSPLKKYPWLCPCPFWRYVQVPHVRMRACHLTLSATEKSSLGHLLKTQICHKLNPLVVSEERNPAELMVSLPEANARILMPPVCKWGIGLVSLWHHWPPCLLFGDTKPRHLKDDFQKHNEGRQRWALPALEGPECSEERDIQCQDAAGCGQARATGPGRGTSLLSAGPWIVGCDQRRTSQFWAPTMYWVFNGVSFI